MTQDTIFVTQAIRDFIAQNFLFSDKGFTYSDEASFLEEGIIDSLGIIELVAFVEKTFAISVADSDLLPTNFDSVSKLSSFVTSKQSSGS